MKLLIPFLWALLLLVSVPLSASHAGDPLLVLVTMDGPADWHLGCIMGQTRSWSMIPHTDSTSVLIAGLLEGFPRMWVFSPFGGKIPGQGNLMTLASREGWETAVFAAPRSELLEVYTWMARSAQYSRLYPPTSTNWDNLLRDFSGWAAMNSAPRFVWLHLSLTDLPPRGQGSRQLVAFWDTFNHTMETFSSRPLCLSLFLPEGMGFPWQSKYASRLAIRGSPAGGVPPCSTPLSSLDIAPTLAHLLDLHYAPDYPGQSLAAWNGLRKRIEPVWSRAGSQSALVGTRWATIMEETQDPASAYRTQFYDLHGGHFSSSAQETEEGKALVRAAILSKQLSDHGQGFVAAADTAPQHDGEGDSSAVIQR